MAAVPTTANPPDVIVLHMSARMRAHAEAGEWNDVETIALELQRAILDVPEADRRAVLVAIGELTGRITSAARAAHEQVGGRLSALRRGRLACEAYRPR